VRCREVLEIWRDTNGRNRVDVSQQQRKEEKQRETAREVERRCMDSDVMHIEHVDGAAELWIVCRGSSERNYERKWRAGRT
jgi:hypothetical protein